MIFRRKITLIISLIFFQLFYLLAHYSGQYLNLFFLLTSLAALIVCYNVYQLLLQIFTSQKIDSELSLLQKQQALKNKHLQFIHQQESNSLKFQEQFTETLQKAQKLLHAGNCEKTHKLIHTALETFQNDRFHPYCEDNLILVILESKRMLAEHSGINVNYQIFLPEKSLIQPTDLSSVLFNLLDNAIEACSSSGFDKPHLSLSLTTSKGFLSILVRNSKNPLEVFDHNTTKENTFYHGLGLSIIEVSAANMTEAGSGMTVKTLSNPSFFYDIVDIKNKISGTPICYSHRLKFRRFFLFIKFSYEKKLSATLISATYPTLPVM